MRTILPSFGFRVGAAVAAQSCSSFFHSSSALTANTGTPRRRPGNPEIFSLPSHLPLSSPPPPPPFLFLILATLHLCKLAQSGRCYFYMRAGERASERAERAGGRAGEWRRCRFPGFFVSTFLQPRPSAAICLSLACTFYCNHRRAHAEMCTDAHLVKNNQQPTNQLLAPKGRRSLKKRHKLRRQIFLHT